MNNYCDLLSYQLDSLYLHKYLMKCMLVEYEEQTESEMVVRPHEISLLYFLISSKQFLRAQQVMDQF